MWRFNDLQRLSKYVTIASNSGASPGFQANMTDVSHAVTETPCDKHLVAKAAQHCEVCTLHCW